MGIASNQRGRRIDVAIPSDMDQADEFVASFPMSLSSPLSGRHLALLSLLMAGSAMAQVYRQVDKNGVVSYSDQPPSRAAQPAAPGRHDRCLRCASRDRHGGEPLGPKGRPSGCGSEPIVTEPAVRSKRPTTPFGRECRMPHQCPSNDEGEEPRR